MVNYAARGELCPGRDCFNPVEDWLWREVGAEKVFKKKIFT